MKICAILQALMRRVLDVYKEILEETHKAGIIPTGGGLLRAIIKIYIFSNNQFNHIEEFSYV
jgi:hypothetical protein